MCSLANGDIFNELDGPLARFQGISHHLFIMSQCLSIHLKSNI